MASLSTCHLGLWLGWQILLNLVIKKQIQLQERYEKLVGTKSMKNITGKEIKITVSGKKHKGSMKRSF